MKYCTIMMTTDGNQPNKQPQYIYIYIYIFFPSSFFFFRFYFVFNCSRLKLLLLLLLFYHTRGCLLGEYLIKLFVEWYARLIWTTRDGFEYHLWFSFNCGGVSGGDQKYLSGIGDPTLGHGGEQSPQSRSVGGVFVNSHDLFKCDCQRYWISRRLDGGPDGQCVSVYLSPIVVHENSQTQIREPLTRIPTRQNEFVVYPVRNFYWPGGYSDDLKKCLLLLLLGGVKVTTSTTAWQLFLKTTL